jgi:hypothetical protein
VADLANGVHNLGSDDLKVALTNTQPSPLNRVLSSIHEVRYRHCSARDITVISSTQTAGLYKLVCKDLALQASHGSVGPYRYIVIYNATPSNHPLIAWFDYGASVFLNESESWPLTFNGPTGLIQLQLG